MDGFVDEMLKGWGEKVGDEIVGMGGGERREIGVAREEHVGGMGEEGREGWLWERIVRGLGNVVGKVGLWVEMGRREVRGIVGGRGKNVRGIGEGGVIERGRGDVEVWWG